MTKNPYKNYFDDLCNLVQEHALEAKKAYDKSKGTDNESYHAGCLMSYHSIVSLMKDQADSFGISLESTVLDELDPDSDLL